MVQIAAQSRKKHGARCADACTYAEKLLYWILARLQEDGLWPVNELDQHPLTDTLASPEKSFLAAGRHHDGVSVLPKCQARRCAYHDWGPFTQLTMDLDNQGKQMRRMVKPLCYKCVRGGKVLDVMCKHTEDDDNGKGTAKAE